MFNFIEQATKKHGNKFDYSKTNYINSKTKVVIICPTHGEFSQFPQTHIKGKGCPQCHLDSLRKTTEQFISEANLVHDNKYDYSKTKYTGALNKVVIICPHHGEFKQIASDHTNNKKGCKKCYTDNVNKGVDEFIKEANTIHKNKYDYSLVNYITNMDKVSIICKEHGIFNQRPYCHIIKKQGCPDCPVVISKPQQEIIDFIKSVCNHKLLINNRSKLNGSELDIFIPSMNIAFEYNGLFWHSYDRKETTQEKKRHSDKVNLCNDHNINLFQIWEHDWCYKKDLIKSMIKGKLGLNNKIYARKCKINCITSAQYSTFLNENHLQGKISNTIKYGLYYNDELISVMGFIKNNKYQWELGRFATKQNITVVGGASKLLSKFIKDHNPQTILSYANRDHSNGNMYKKLGFELLSITQPGYFYVKNSVVYSRQQFQKHKLKQKLNSYDETLTEYQNMFNNGYRRAWNSGNLKYLWSKNTN